MTWPEGKRFAFTIFDDPDGQSLEHSRLVYSYLTDLGLRTTKAVWPMGPVREPNSGGETCGNPDYVEHVLQLQELGFEVGYHNATVHPTIRAETLHALDLFRNYFGHDPWTMANHYNTEAIYWGDARVTGIRRSLYNLVQLGRRSGQYFGHIEGHPSFWGDACRARIRFCRNFAYSSIHTLDECPWMPYHDPQRPYVPAWFSACDGNEGRTFCASISEANQEHLEERGGACILYTHFGLGFVERGQLSPRFKSLMDRLRRKNGWFVSVNTLLEYLREQHGVMVISDAQRASLELRWLREKIFRGTS